MGMRRFGLGLAAMAALAMGGGCKKSAPAPVPAAALSAETVARVHWLGKKRMAAQTNAAYLIALWNLPESAKLETQTLDRLALALTMGQSTNLVAAGGEIGSDGKDGTN